MNQIIKQYGLEIKRWTVTLLSSLVLVILSLTLVHTDVFWDDLTYFIVHVIGMVLLGWLVDAYVLTDNDTQKKTSAYLFYVLSQFSIYSIYYYLVNTVGWPPTSGRIAGIQIGFILIYSVLVARKVGQRDGGQFNLGVLRLVEEGVNTLGYYIITLLGVYSTMAAVQYMVYEFDYIYYLDAAILMGWVYSQYLVLRLSTKNEQGEGSYLARIVEWVGVPLLVVYTISLCFGLVTGQPLDIFNEYSVWFVYLIGGWVIYWMLRGFQDRGLNLTQLSKLYTKTYPAIAAVMSVIQGYNLYQYVTDQPYHYLERTVYYLVVGLILTIALGVNHYIKDKHKNRVPYLIIVAVIITQLPYIGINSLMLNQSEGIINDILSTKPHYIGDDGKIQESSIEETDYSELNTLRTHYYEIESIRGVVPNYQGVNISKLTKLSIPYTDYSMGEELNLYTVGLFKDGYNISEYDKMTHLDTYEDEVTYLGDDQFELKDQQDIVDLGDISHLNGEIRLKDAVIETKNKKDFIIENVYIGMSDSSA